MSVSTTHVRHHEAWFQTEVRSVKIASYDFLSVRNKEKVYIESCLCS